MTPRLTLPEPSDRLSAVFQGLQDVCYLTGLIMEGASWYCEWPEGAWTDGRC